MNTRMWNIAPDNTGVLWLYCVPMTAPKRCAVIDPQQRMTTRYRFGSAGHLDIIADADQEGTVSVYLLFSGLPPSPGITNTQEAHALHTPVDRPVSTQSATTINIVSLSSISGERTGPAHGGGPGGCGWRLVKAPGGGGGAKRPTNLHAGNIYVLEQAVKGAERGSCGEPLW